MTRVVGQSAAQLGAAPDSDPRFTGLRDPYFIARGSEPVSTRSVRRIVSMRRSAKIAFIGLLTSAMVIGAGYVVLRKFYPIATLTTIEKLSPNRIYRAVLVTREAGFDVNVFLEVDGSTVYVSPDFAAPAIVDFQEQLMWDRTGRVAVIEIAGKRFFGYDVLDRRPLYGPELAAVQLSPFEQLRFTSDSTEDVRQAAPP